MQVLEADVLRKTYYPTKPQLGCMLFECSDLRESDERAHRMPPSTGDDSDTRVGEAEEMSCQRGGKIVRDVYGVNLLALATIRTRTVRQRSLRRVC